MSFAIHLLKKLWISNLGLVWEKNVHFQVFCALWIIQPSRSVYYTKVATFKSKHTLENMFWGRGARRNLLMCWWTSSGWFIYLLRWTQFVRAVTHWKLSSFRLCVRHGARIQTSWISWDMLRGEFFSTAENGHVTRGKLSGVTRPLVCADLKLRSCPRYIQFFWRHVNVLENLKANCFTYGRWNI